jgi:hypothetical protein
MWLLKLPLYQNSMVILRATSNLGGQKEDKGMMCSIIQLTITQHERIENEEENIKYYLSYLYGK